MESRGELSSAHAGAARQIESNHQVALVAHELRDPLVPIINAAAVISSMPHEPALVRRAAAVIDRQARIMGSIIDELMDVTRLRKGLLQLERTQISVAEIVRRCLEIAGPACVDRNQRLRAQVSQMSMEMHADVPRIVQCLRSLILNAAKYSEPGSEVRVAVERVGADAIVEVIDDGIGIPAADLETIFLLFIQGGSGVGRSNGGIGIGLFLARHYAEAHGGSLRASSPGVGRGSTFTLRLPCLPI